MPSSPLAFTAASDDIEVTILMPRLNEAEILATCIDKARAAFERTGIAGEVVVADNGSTDGSQAIAEAHGAPVVPIAVRGFGAALAGGIAAARCRYVLMGDADDSYDFGHAERYVFELRKGYDLVMGNRFAGGIARLLFGSPCGDIQCGLGDSARRQRLAWISALRAWSSRARWSSRRRS